MAYTTIDDPEAYFQVKLYTGSGSIQAITLDGDTDMQPDFIWCRSRGADRHHYLADAVRGVKGRLRSDVDNANYTAGATDGFDSFDSDGFTLEEDASSLGLNESSHSMVAWCWKANGTGSSNTDGTINTTATSASTTSGFSITQYTGNATDNATVGHGLGVAAEMLLGKDTSDGSGWVTWHKRHTNAAYRMSLSSTGSQWDNTDALGGTGRTLPTSTVFSLGSAGGLNGTNGNIVYCFASVQGFSAIGSYEGNGNADGTFVYTGFRPAYVMTKSIDSTSSWQIFDNKREGYNVDNDALVAEARTLEGTTDYIDLLSNGFKLRIATDPNVAETFIYMAFAEAPFVNSNGVPNNAR